LETLELDFISDDTLAGFRLNRLEVYNWGTFDGRIWQVDLQGENGLLTGDIGSGKSTLVDALTTLLVPPQKITFNKAAGAETRERTLASYVLGYYKSEKDTQNLSARAIALRDSSHFSVLLAHFHNAGYLKDVTIAQVLWMKDHQSTPERFYVMAPFPLSIKNDFTHFGSHMTKLKKRLKKESGLHIFDSFSRYAAEFKRHLGIKTSSALNLFYQTVSMKSVGNLTRFVRGHMLEPPPIAEKVEDICRSFDNLSQAHDAVAQARKKIGMLKPLVKHWNNLGVKEREIHDLTQYRQALEPFFSFLKANLLIKRIQHRQAELKQMSSTLAREKKALAEKRRDQISIQRSIEEHGGRRLDDLTREIEFLTRDRDSRLALAESYQQCCRNLDFPTRLDAGTFFANHENAQLLKKELRRQAESIEEEQVDLRVTIQNLDRNIRDLDEELRSLKNRRSNIPRKNMEIRRELCQVLELEEGELPFAGELIQVRENQSEWEGAVERLMRSFGLSMLVPLRCYKKVLRYVDKTHLQGRLVYFKVDEVSPGGIRELDPDSLIYKIDIKSHPVFTSWLEEEIARRFNYQCCRDMKAFQHKKRAITMQGQTKSGGIRHEKDDRFAIHDRSRYVLGWSNQAKINALTAEQSELKARGETLIHKAEAISTRLREIRNQRDKVLELLRFDEFNELLWRPLTEKIQKHKEEIKAIEKGSDMLKMLREQLSQLMIDIEKREETIGNRRELLGRRQNSLLVDQDLFKKCRESTYEYAVEERKDVFAQLRIMKDEALPEKKLTIENMDKSQSLMRNWIQSRLDTLNRAHRVLASNVVSLMQAYKIQYPLDTQEMDVALESAHEFKEILTRLKREDLPRHEARFKAMLNEGTINDIALFQNQLQKFKQEILEKIATINRSLHAIDYTEGSYIELVSDLAQDPEIRTFQADLRACLAGSLDDEQSDVYSEQRFLLVKAIIERFNGREGLSDLDRKWKMKVTDVRNWFVFSAMERWREDQSEKEFFSDAAGKSGGQKEKLAYTILASALAYQFGLEWGEKKSRSFRFVMIDEAFGRGSDESARFGLEVFKKLNLQLLIVTPLQKIHVIEDYVSSVHLIHNIDDKNSMIRSLTIESFREEKERSGQTR